MKIKIVTCALVHKHCHCRLNLLLHSTSNQHSLLLRSLSSVITNGVGANTLLLGNQLNPSSAVAQKMTDTLHAELEAHSIYKDEDKISNMLVGPSLPGKKEVMLFIIFSSVAMDLLVLSSAGSPH